MSDNKNLAKQRLSEDFGVVVKKPAKKSGKPTTKKK